MGGGADVGNFSAGGRAPRSDFNVGGGRAGALPLRTEDGINDVPLDGAVDGSGFNDDGGAPQVRAGAATDVAARAGRAGGTTVDGSASEPLSDMARFMTTESECGGGFWNTKHARTHAHK